MSTPTSVGPVSEGFEESLAELAVAFGANVQPGQVVALSSEIGKERLTRKVIAAAYRRGARYVDVEYFDPWAKRTRIEHAAPDSLSFVPSWYGERVRDWGRQRCARIRLGGSSAPDLLQDLDQQLVGLDQLPRVKEITELNSERTTNWTLIPAPTEGWATTVFPDRSPADALARLSADVARMLRLDAADPVAAWAQWQSKLSRRAALLSDLRLDALHFKGPGTDLTVGLFPSSRWTPCQDETVSGVRFCSNLPSEEVFTAPDPRRVDGYARLTRPVVLLGGVRIEDMTVRFAAGRVSELSASLGEGAIRARLARDDGAARLGEVALVAGGRIAELDRVYYDGLIDENATCHLAFGHAYLFCIDDAEERRLGNVSEIHIDFMVGGADVRVDGITASGAVIPLVDGDRWLLAQG